MANKNFDECVSFLIDNGLFVGRICRLENVLKTIIAKHGYMKNVSAALSESTALAVLLANALKFDGLFTLQMQGNGPVSTIVVDVTSDGKLRSCANYDKERLEKAFALRKNEGEIEATPHLLGEGTLAFTIDDGKNNYHQGVVDLQGKTLEECALRYFKQSMFRRKRMENGRRVALLCSVFQKSVVKILIRSSCRNFETKLKF